MQLTKLIILVSAALGAVAQYDDGLYDEAVYEDGLSDNIDEYAIGATVYEKPDGRPGPKYLVQNWNRCEQIKRPVGGNVESIRVPHRARCGLFRDSQCQRLLPPGVYNQGLHNVGGLPRHAHYIKCRKLY